MVPRGTPVSRASAAEVAAGRRNDMSEKYMNPTKVITGPETRWSYANVWEPKAINDGKPKYSVSLIIPKSDKKTIAKVKVRKDRAA